MNRKKNILLISTTTLQYDGLTKVIFSLIDQAPHDLVNIEIILGKGAKSGFREQLDERRVIYHEVPDRELDVRHYIPALRKIVRAKSYDVVHIHGNSATMALDLAIAKRAGVPVRIAHSHNTMSKHPFVHGAMRSWLNRVVTDPVACSKAAGDFLFTKPFTIFPNAIDVSRFGYHPETREKVRKALNLTGKIVIGHIGRFTYQKNHEKLVAVFKAFYDRHPEARLLLIGEGEQASAIRHQVEALDLADEVIFYGTTPHVADLMQAMDVFVLPSRYEGLGITAVEAQAAGLPCVLADTIPAEAKITDDCAFVALQASPQVWADAIETIMRKPADRLKQNQEVRDSVYNEKNLPPLIHKMWHLASTEKRK